MPNPNRFSYRSLSELQEAIAAGGLDLPACDDLSVLAEPVAFGRLTVPNRFVCQPMEGCDSEADGSPSKLTVRKYRRFAAGGAGMIWWEATAVVPEGRANPRQIWLNENTVESFAEMLRQARQAAMEAGHQPPIAVLQLTHSGRYSRPGRAPAPIIAHHSAVLDPRHKLPPDYPLITDEHLDELQFAFVAAARLAAQAGFDAVDIKSCHRYLLSELLASFTRENSRYGGSFENRTRMLRETLTRVRQAVGGQIEVTSRLNAYDAIEHPYGWGVSPGDVGRPDLAEPTELIRQLHELGAPGVNVTIGNPYFNPYVNRPADWMIAGWPEPPEHPLMGVGRIVGVVRQLQQSLSDVPIVGSGYSWLRHYMPNFAAAAVKAGWVTLIGLGRGALAYPDFAADVISGRGMDPHKVCVACSSCTQMMRDGVTSGCVVRDTEVYGPLFRRGRHRDPETMRQHASRCRQCADAMCVAACPAGVDIPGFLGALAEGDERRAYDVLRKANPLPGVCGAVCPVEVQCQSACIQNCLSDGPVDIGRLQRDLSLRAIAQGWAAVELPDEFSGQRVAVVGAGPAGVAAAIELLRRGHGVTIFDRATRAGGKLGSVIPPERIDEAQTQAEIHAILDSVPPERLTWRLGGSLGQDFTLDSLLTGGEFSAVVLAMGLGGGISLPGGQGCPGVVQAGEFLRQMHENPDYAVPSRVAVLGGGNTAMDAACCARQRGAVDVFLVYRRSYEQMPAWPVERDGALHGGVHFLLLCQPTEYVTGPAGKLAGLRVTRTELGPPAADGRRQPRNVPDSQFVLNVEMAIEALGEGVAPGLRDALAGVELARDGRVIADPQTLATSRPGVWAAGDLVNGGTTVVRAVAEGVRAADSIHASLVGQRA